ncbi:phosphatidylethanolamine N-methyltransferase [Patellaria atrata CBS 101060]|uniref:Phosphatidyl-N-methylethanolamine N-methyltransferase n=1 Tax=Patellaria atrata CBS 101060 TaxID=1346257 RepID=A0A9P4VSV8_9PEZI|nr:phosphatidylethanolamine N-methyltransferase [Patellaria atrata CBS 101060]
MAVCSHDTLQPDILEVSPITKQQQTHPLLTVYSIAARQEYHNKTITKLFNNNPRHGCYTLAATIFTLGIIRDLIYERALRPQPPPPPLQSPTIQHTGTALFLTGNLLVLSSMYALGLTGTYLGDYFGILMDAPVTSFPFNLTSAPMYQGSALSFLGSALYWGKPAGVGLAAVVWVAYSVALRFEDPFTAEIYAKRDRERAKKAS